MLDFLILQVMFSAAIKTYLEVLETPEKASPQGYADKSRERESERAHLRRSFSGENFFHHQGIDPYVLLPLSSFQSRVGEYIKHIPFRILALPISFLLESLWNWNNCSLYARTLYGIVSIRQESNFNSFCSYIMNL